MAIHAPGCFDTQYELLKKILLSLPDIAGGDVTQAGDNNFTGTNTFNGPFLVPCSIDAANRQLLDSGCAISVDWANRLLVDSAGVTFLDWENGTINGLVYPSADGAAGDILTTDGAGNLTLQPPAPSSRITTSYSLSRMTVGGGQHITFAHGVVPVGKTLTMQYVQSIVDDGTTPAVNQIVVVHNVTTATTAISANGNFLGPVTVAVAGQEWYARFENNAATNIAVNASVHGYME